MHSTQNDLPVSRKELRGSISRANTATLPAINKKALLNDTFTAPHKKKTLTPLSNAPKTPKFNNFLASSSEGAPLSLTFGSLELAITGGNHEEDVESMNISHFVKTPEHKRCVKMLTEGFVDSFVDFFYLTHKKDANTNTEEEPQKSPIDELNESGAISLHDMPNDVLDFLMNRLSEAEDAKREGDASGVVKAYRELASHFEERTDFKTAVHFHQKGLDSSFRLGDSSHAADSYKLIGVDYEKIGNIPLAIQYFDKYSDIVQQVPNNKDAIAASFRHLVTAYRTFASQLEEKAALDGSEETLRNAVEYYQKCLVMAKNCADTSAEGTVNYRLGLVYKQLDKIELSIKHLQNYLYICRINGDTEGESAACSALADSFRSSNDIHQSVKYLEENIVLAKRTSQPASQAHACRDLGVIYDQQEDYEKALEYFEKYYSLALESKDRSLIDNARVYLGIARGNMKLMQMFNISNHSITPATMKPMPPRTGTPSGARPRSSSGSSGSSGIKSALRGSGGLARDAAPAAALSSSSSSSSSTEKSHSRSRGGTPRSPSRPDSTRRPFDEAPLSGRAATLNNEDTSSKLSHSSELSSSLTNSSPSSPTETEHKPHPHPHNIDIPPLNINMHTSPETSHELDVDSHRSATLASSRSEKEETKHEQVHTPHSTHAEKEEIRHEDTHAPHSARVESPARSHRSTHADGSPRRPLTAHEPLTARSESARRPRTAHAVASARSSSRGGNNEIEDEDGGRPRTPNSGGDAGGRDEESVHTPHRPRTPNSARPPIGDEHTPKRVRTPPTSARASAGAGGVGGGEISSRVRTPPSTHTHADGSPRMRSPSTHNKRASTAEGERVRTPSSARLVVKDNEDEDGGDLDGKSIPGGDVEEKKEKVEADDESLKEEVKEREDEEHKYQDEQRESILTTEEQGEG